MRSLLEERADPQGGVVPIVQQGTWYAAALEFDAKGKEISVGKPGDRKGSFQHLEMVVAYDTVKNPLI